MTRPLTRAALGRPAAAVRILHLGLGGFFRAHQAWYTEHAPDAADWGIAAFSGRSTALAARLAAQDGLYTVVTRGPADDHFEVVGSLAAAHPGSDHAAWLAHWRRPELAVVTLTVTEAGYTRGSGGHLDTALPQVCADLEALRADATAPVGTMAARVLAGLAARQRSGLGPVAIVPCDNLPGNGPLTADVLAELADALGGGPWRTAAAHASYVTTMVDRITPYSAPEDAAAVAAATGWADTAPVVTEPYTEWVLSGTFPAGRPAWEDAGARFVTDIASHEHRKLWLLNGGHSLLAYAGPLRGHGTVAEAVADPLCRAWLEEWWQEAGAHLGLPGRELADYRAALLERFSNPRIRHTLAKIAEDGSQKLPVRVVPVLLAERERGAMPSGGVRLVAAWLLQLRGAGAPVQDTAAPSTTGTLADGARSALTALDVRLGHDTALIEAVTTQAEQIM
ncbi:mannitol dehydrogenase family protein [Actinomadura fibrosa]|uniref:Mannitol dehydrogenase family protein n=1 Tax=Actinomadura fibrosa TaxID=111802 RepID=A0ABW2XXA3_9ACTN|nr:mannitol dehydrogenase family protein [Actinomadura fibrosa]